MRGAHLLDHPGGDHRIDTPVDARVELAPLHRQTDESRRVAYVVAPQLRVALRRFERADLLELQRTHEAMAIGGVDPRGSPRRALLEQRVEGLGTAAFELGIPALARAGLRRRAQR